MTVDRVRRALNELRTCIMREMGGRRRFRYPMPETSGARKLPYAKTEMEYAAVRMPPLERAQTQDFLTAPKSRFHWRSCRTGRIVAPNAEGLSQLNQ